MIATRFWELQPVRFGYAGYIAGRIVLGYQSLILTRRTGRKEAYEQRLRAQHHRSALRIYNSVLQLQGLMIKLGQTIGSRPDLFPEEYFRVLSRLQDRVPPRPFGQMKPYIEGELGSPIDTVFAEFDSKPVAAASLAQVYRAKLHDGRSVAVKVLYPNIERLVQTDLRILKMAVGMESRFYHFPLEPVYRELAANIPHEVDMLHEAHNMEEIASQMSHRDDLVIPEVVWEHTSKRILTMQFIDGIKITEVPRLVEAGIDPTQIFPLLTDVYFEQILRHGHFHADPHPGNLMALPGNRLAMLDFGLTKRFTPEFRETFRETTRAMFNGDTEAMVAGMRAQGFRAKNDNDNASFIATGDFFRAMSDPNIYKDREVMEAINEAWIDTLKKNPAVQVPGEMALPMRVFGLLFGLGATIGGSVEIGPKVIAETVLKHANGARPAETPSSDRSPAN